MSRISDRLALLITKAQMSEAFFLLLTLNHPTWAQPLRYVNSQSDLNSNGVLYKARGFSVPMPTQSKIELPEVSLTINNVDREVSYKVASITDRRPGTAILSVIASGAPDVVEAGPANLRWTNPTLTGETYTLTLTPYAGLQDTYPMHTYSPAYYPGLY